MPTIRTDTYLVDSSGEHLDFESETTTPDSRLSFENGVKGVVPSENIERDNKNYEVTFLSYTKSLAVGDGQFYFRVPHELHGWFLSDANIQVITAGVSSTSQFQIHNTTLAADLLTTKIYLDHNSRNSSLAAIQPLIDKTKNKLAVGHELRLDCDQINTTAPKGGILTLTFSPK